jgi:hypothetical protein
MSTLEDSTRQTGKRRTEIRTNLNGQFTAKLLVKKAGIQRIRTVWNDIYVKQTSFPLSKQPDSNFQLDKELRLPINFSPFRVTNVLGQGMAAVEIRLEKLGNETEDILFAHPLGDGYYEARELLDGVYTMTIHKDGYQDITGNFSVNGGEQTQEQDYSLPHYVTIQGTIINGKGMGVEGAEIRLAGLNSQLVSPDKKITTAADGSFQIDLLVIGSENRDLREHLEVSWNDPTASQGLNRQTARPTPFGISYDFSLPATPGNTNLGLLSLPANFFPVTVQNTSGRGLSGVQVTFIDENGNAFAAKEFIGGFYEGQNLPDGMYTVAVAKDGYQDAQKTGVRITSTPMKPSSSEIAPLTFQLPYYIDIQGTTVNGKGQELLSDITLKLSGPHNRLLPETIAFDQAGTFKAKVLVNNIGREQLDIIWKGEYGLHALNVPFALPDTPQTVDLQRLSLPINFIPIEVKDLLGYGLTGATVTLNHLESDQKIVAKEWGNGQYEGENLLDGSYKISVSKEGYKPVEDALVSVFDGMVSETKSFRLKHYVWITGKATNGDGEGVRDPAIKIRRLRSIDTSKQSDITGQFEVQLEVQDVGNERMQLAWKNLYYSPVVFKLPEKPGKKDLGEIRLPINFLSILVTDISGSTLADVDVRIKEDSGRIHVLKTDQNGFCKTYDLPNGQYQITVNKSGYQAANRSIQLRDGQNVAVRFTLPHYVIVKGYVRDIMQNPVSDAEVVFEEFVDSDGQTLRTMTDPLNGQFEQKLLINNSAFLEHQKGHFLIAKGDLKQTFTFKIPTVPNRVIHYKTLLFPINYLRGKVVDTEIQTVPIDNAKIALTFVGKQTPETNGTSILSTQKTDPQQPFRLTTDSLGTFNVANLQQGEYRITIQKDGYITHEDFIQISGLLQEQEFTLQKE